MSKSEASIYSDEVSQKVFIDTLVREFERSSTFNKEKVSMKELFFTKEFDQGRSEVRLGFRYDHHAYAIVDRGVL